MAILSPVAPWSPSDPLPNRAPDRFRNHFKNMRRGQVAGGRGRDAAAAMSCFQWIHPRDPADPVKIPIAHGAIIILHVLIKSIVFFKGKKPSPPKEQQL